MPAPPASRLRKTNKKAPYFSQEFFIQNYADVVSTVAIIVVLGVFVPMTSNFCMKFVALQHIVTTEMDMLIHYNVGWLDICAVLYYSLCCILMHALIQEYIFDKVNKRLHLSKTKHSLFDESGQLFVYHVVFTGVAGKLIFSGNFLHPISTLWEDYPHVELTPLLKFFYILQMAYWVHCLPMLYFLRVKKEEWPAKIKYAAINMLYVAAAYAFNFHRIGTVLLFLYHLSRSMYHFEALAGIVDRDEKYIMHISKVSNSIFALSFVATIFSSFLTFYYGLSFSDIESVDVSTGNYNTVWFRYAALAAIWGLKLYMMFYFIKNILSKNSQNGGLDMGKTKPDTSTDTAKGSLRKKRGEKKSKDDELTEVDQNLKKAATRSGKAAHLKK